MSEEDLEVPSEVLALATTAAEKGVVAMAHRAGYSPEEALGEYREFLATCPHEEAALAFMLFHLANQMSRLASPIGSNRAQRPAWWPKELP